MRAAAATVAAALVSLVVAVSILGGVIGSGSATATGSITAAELAAQRSCAFSGVLTGLTAEQSSDAEAIVSAASALAAENRPAARIALMTAYDESNLVNLGPEAGNDGPSACSSNGSAKDGARLPRRRTRPTPRRCSAYQA